MGDPKLVRSGDFGHLKPRDEFEALKSRDEGFVGFSTAETKLQQSDDSDAKLFTDVVGESTTGGTDGCVGISCATC